MINPKEMNVREIFFESKVIFLNRKNQSLVYKREL